MDRLKILCKNIMIRADSICAIATEWSYEMVKILLHKQTDPVAVNGLKGGFTGHLAF
jgi:hypothetical protein